MSVWISWEAARVSGRGADLADALADFCDTLDFQCWALRTHDLTPGARRARDTIDAALPPDGSAPD